MSLESQSHDPSYGYILELYDRFHADPDSVDGREAVQFLVHIKQLVEDPEQLLLGG